MSLITIARTAVLALAGLAATAAVQPGFAADSAVKGRRGYWQIVLYEFGSVKGYVQGKTTWDAGAVGGHASRLKALSAYPVGTLFVAGTAKSDRSGDTRAHEDIWSDPDGFGKAFGDWQAAISALAAADMSDKSAVTSAFAAVGKTCGACRDDYRHKDF